MSVLVKVVEKVRRLIQLITIRKSAEQIVDPGRSLFVAVRAVVLILKQDHPAPSTLLNAFVSRSARFPLHVEGIEGGSHPMKVLPRVVNGVPVCMIDIDSIRMTARHLLRNDAG
jgi:hypothetical protein